MIAYGENASDIGDFRPGAKAAAEFQVRAPLKEAGLTKAEIRELSAQLGLPTADKPQMACLSSRVPYGEMVTPEKLRMIERAEYVLRDLGFRDVRVRHHEMKVARDEWRVTGNAQPSDTDPATGHPSPVTHLARIELARRKFRELLADGKLADGGRGVEENRLHARHAGFAGLPARQHKRSARQEVNQFAGHSGFGRIITLPSPSPDPST